MFAFGVQQRKRGSKAGGGTWSIAELWAVFTKGRVVPGLAPEMYRLDACEMLMQWNLHGDTTPGGYGWEIDHIRPVTHVGSDDLWNLQPLQWQNNRAKGDGPLVCEVRWR